MIEFCRKAVGNYLKDYIDIEQGHLYSEEKIIQCGIAELINHNIFTPEELQRDILRKCSVLLPVDDIAAWAEREW